MAGWETQGWGLIAHVPHMLICKYLVPMQKHEKVGLLGALINGIRVLLEKRLQGGYLPLPQHEYSARNKHL
jgi:hypothetical protein